MNLDVINYCSKLEIRKVTAEKHTPLYFLDHSLKNMIRLYLVYINLIEALQVANKKCQMYLPYNVKNEHDLFDW